jgi:hypothetical protein
VVNVEGARLIDVLARYGCCVPGVTVRAVVAFTAGSGCFSRRSKLIESFQAVVTVVTIFSQPVDVAMLREATG